jgi:hypothetical protein
VRPLKVWSKLRLVVDQRMLLLPLLYRIIFFEIKKDMVWKKYWSSFFLELRNSGVGFAGAIQQLSIPYVLCTHTVFFMRTIRHFPLLLD